MMKGLFIIHISIQGNPIHGKNSSITRNNFIP